MPIWEKFYSRMNMRSPWPGWLFERMVRLAREITLVMIEEQGANEMLRRLSDPFWFQAFGCVLGFDWHSSGVTTTVCGAMKEGLRGLEHRLGFYVAGGKGRRSRKTPSEVETFCEGIGRDAQPLVYASRMSAKVDSSALQDGYQLYHHSFFFTGEGVWCVVQQGMNETTRYARRYHWLSENLQEFVVEPHAAVCSEARGRVLNLVARESDDSREIATQLACQSPNRLLAELRHLECLELPRRHDIWTAEDINPQYLHKILLRTYERQPENFEALLGIEGVGPKTLRALSLIGELLYGKKPSFRDPARFSFAHGGKDGIPYPVDRQVYEQSIQVLERGIRRAPIENSDKRGTLERLRVFYEGAG